MTSREARALMEVNKILAAGIRLVLLRILWSREIGTQTGLSPEIDLLQYRVQVIFHAFEAFTAEHQMPRRLGRLSRALIFHNRPNLFAKTNMECAVDSSTTHS